MNISLYQDSNQGFSYSASSPHQICDMCGNLALILHRVFHALDRSYYRACPHCLLAVRHMGPAFCPTCNE